MPKQPTDKLTRREREIMNAIFALGNCASAEEVQTRLVDPPSDASVRLMLTRLQKKGFLKHQQEGVRYLIPRPSRRLSPNAIRCSKLSGLSLVVRCDR